ncbi:hypothetical protein D917_00164, partial [Trichinella nativa]
LTVELGKLFGMQSKYKSMLYKRDSISGVVVTMHVILIISLFWTTSEQTRFVTYFSEENLSCLLEHRHLKQNETSVLEKLPLSTLTDCIVACYLRNRSDPFEDTDEEH